MEAISIGNKSWGLASLPLPGETETGDTHVVKSDGSTVLIAVVDALGHGQDAARAARVAKSVLEQWGDEALDALLRRCDALMRETRGAAISMALLDTLRWTLTWLGVGNVAGALVNTNPAVHPRVTRMIVRGGVVGYQLPDLRPSVIPVAPGDTLVLATDGVSSDFAESLPATLGPQPLADQIMMDYATNSDDALVLVYPFTAAPERRTFPDRRGEE